MSKEDKKRVLGAFARENLASVLLFVGNIFIFLGIFKLYQIPMEPFFYAVVLSVFCGAIPLVRKMWKAFKNAEYRQHLAQTMDCDTDAFREPVTLEEADYQEMLCVLRGKCAAITTGWESERQESVDYYTTWVHQIKTPISVLRMIVQSEDTEEHRAIAAELFRIEQYVEMVLNYIRLESDTNDFAFQEYDMDELIRQAIHKYAPQFVRRKIKLCYEPVNLKVITDEKWMVFIIEQMLSNAIKYTYQGSVTIRMQDYGKIDIIDTGIGIAAEDLPRIFEKGFTGFNGRADKKSTGLGLYLCKQAADKIAVRLSAMSAPGSGSTFSMHIPMEKIETE
ncbi:MAG: sensor histidine kinase [Acetatifactor sp.]|nr:sensor histidine kinase [Acetatifactor sp.]